MSEDNIQKVFEKFHRHLNSTVVTEKIWTVTKKSGLFYKKNFI